MVPFGESSVKLFENDVFDFTLTEEDMTAIATLDTKTNAFFSHYAPQHGGMVRENGGGEKDKEGQQQGKKNW